MEKQTADEGGKLLASLPESPGLDELFDALSNERRRRVVRYLNDRRAPIALADLAREVAAREEGVATDDVGPDEVERVHVSLYHVHVPKLADRGLVEYDPDRGLVSPPEHGEAIGQVVDLATHGD